MHRILATPFPLEALAASILTLALSFALAFGGQLGAHGAQSVLSVQSAQGAEPAPILLAWDQNRPPGSWATS